MRVAIYDGIQEAHLAESLERALVSRGHVVYNTGKFGVGFNFPKTQEETSRLKYYSRKVCNFNPDLILVFRPASAPGWVLEYFRKKSSAKIFAWLCDDPVLWELSYRKYCHEYDVLLHCGDVDVIRMYDEYLHRAGGVNFPFWTDNKAFPHAYGQKQFDSDAVFLGNAQGDLRRNRYYELSKLRCSVKIHGLTGYDYLNLNGGYLDSDREVVESCARSRFAINFPQYFKDHKGLETWFESLKDFSFFPFPSRVIQYAAIGIPVVCILPDSFKVRHFPELITVNSIDQLNLIIKGQGFWESLDQLGEETHDRFERNFSALSRVLALESMMEDDSWRGLNALERSEWFTQFDGAESAELVVRHADKVERPPVRNLCQSAINKRSHHSNNGQSFCVLNYSSSTGYFSSADMLRRSLSRRGWKELTLDGRQAPALGIYIVDRLQDCLRVATIHEKAVLIIREGDLPKVGEQLKVLESFDKVITRSTAAYNSVIEAGVPEEKVTLGSFILDEFEMGMFALGVQGSKNESRYCLPLWEWKILVLMSRNGTSLSAATLHDLAEFKNVRRICVDDLKSIEELQVELEEADVVVVSAEKLNGSNIIPDWFGYAYVSDCLILYARTLSKFMPKGLGERFLSVGFSGEFPAKLERIRQKQVNLPWLSDLRITAEILQNNGALGALGESELDDNSGFDLVVELGSERLDSDGVSSRALIKFNQLSKVNSLKEYFCKSNCRLGVQILFRSLDGNGSVKVRFTGSEKPSSMYRSDFLGFVTSLGVVLTPSMVDNYDAIELFSERQNKVALTTKVIVANEKSDQTSSRKKLN